MEEQSYQQNVSKKIQELNKEDRLKLDMTKLSRRQYAEELKKQMEDHKEKELKQWNEMDERTMAINMRPLQAFEAMDTQTGNRMLPGFQTKEEKDNFRRFTKKAFKPDAPMLYHTLGAATDRPSRAILSAKESPP